MSFLSELFLPTLNKNHYLDILSAEVRSIADENSLSVEMVVFSIRGVHGRAKSAVTLSNFSSLLIVRCRERIIRMVSDE